MKNINILINIDHNENTISNILTKTLDKSIVIEMNNSKEHELENKKSKIISSHLSNGILNYSDIFFSEDYILNPIQFMKEFEKYNNYTSQINFYRHKDCKFYLPFDLLLDDLKIKTFGTKDIGINEFDLRDERLKIKYSFYEFAGLDKFTYLRYMNKFYNEFYIPRILELRLKHDKVINDFKNEDFLLKYLQNCKEMNTIIKVKNYKFLTNYDNVIFDNNQTLNFSLDIVNRIFKKRKINLCYIVLCNKEINVQEMKTKILKDLSYLKKLELNNFYNINLILLDYNNESNLAEQFRKPFKNIYLFYDKEIKKYE